jgi:hypothetical protein
MPNHSPLTYGQLHAKLRELGFEEYAFELDGKRGRLFEHKAKPGASIVLPERDTNTPVEPFYLQTVLVTLRTRGLLAESNPLVT